MKGSLPDKYDWIDGGKVNEPINFWTRVANTYLPWKIHDKISPEKEFLQQIEFDARPSLKTDGRGTDYTAEQRSNITSIMGREGDFKRGLQRIMQSTSGKQFRKLYREALKTGVPIDRQVLDNLHYEVEMELRNAQRWAEATSEYREAVANQRYENDVVESYVRRGDVEGAQEFLEKYQHIK